MITVDITLHSAVTKKSTVLRSVHIVNDATGDLDRGNYDVYLVDKNGKRYRHARVEGYPRKAYPVQKLVSLALRKLGS